MTTITVQDLIEELEMMNPEAEVFWYLDQTYCSQMGVPSVDEAEDGRVAIGHSNVTYSDLKF